MGESTPIEIARATRSTVAEIVATAGFEPPPRFLDRIETFAAALALWGTKLNLTAAPDDPAELAFHIIDSLAPLIIANGGKGPIVAGSHATLARQIPDTQLLDAPRKGLEDNGLTSPTTLISDSNVPATRNRDRPNLTTLPPTARTSTGLRESVGTQVAGAELTDAFVTEAAPMRAARTAFPDALRGGSNRIIVERSVLADAFVAGSRILDLGSGAGFPALILAAACDADFLLMEVRRKRASFLRVTAAEMGLSNVQVDSARAEPAALPSAPDEASRTHTIDLRNIRAESALADDRASRTVRGESSRTDTVALPKIRTDSSPGEMEASRRAFDVVTARAFAEPAIVFETAAAVLKAGGRVILYASAAQREVIERASAAMFEPPVFLRYDLKHASTGRLGSSSSDGISDGGIGTPTRGGPVIVSTGKASDSTVSIARAANMTVAGSSSSSIVEGSTAGVDGGGIPGDTDRAGSPVMSGVVHMLAICRRR